MHGQMLIDHLKQFAGRGHAAAFDLRPEELAVQRDLEGTRGNERALDRVAQEEEHHAGG